MGAKKGGFLVSRLVCEKRVVSLFGFGSCPQEQLHVVCESKTQISAIPVSSHKRPRTRRRRTAARIARIGFLFGDRFPAREILSRLLVFKLSQGILLLVIRRQIPRSRGEPTLQKSSKLGSWLLKKLGFPILRVPPRFSMDSEISTSCPPPLKS